jgi:hypothetical protein
MQDLFRGYYKPTPEELAEIWKTCIFSFDANVCCGLCGLNECPITW